MNIVVCIKQVPEIALVKVTATEGVILPAGTGTMNPFDEYAVEESIRLREKHGGTVTALSCGGDDAVSGLRDAIALGADRAVLLADAAFAGSDGVAIGRILAAAIDKIGAVDVCLFGKNAVDTDRSVVPGATAGALGWPQVLFVKQIAAIADRRAELLRTTEDGFDRVSVTLPVVISVVKEINEPRLPSLKGKIKAKSAPVDRWSASDLAIDVSHIGTGSATRVRTVSPPAERTGCEMLTGDAQTVARSLYQKLREQKVI